jgi:hypothetical protein
MPPVADSVKRSRESGRCFSLPMALKAIVQQCGADIDWDDLLAATGLSLMVCRPLGTSRDQKAQRSNDSVADWALYARDAFLAEGARLFGMEVREIHPPEAAIGLPGVTEFGQHFDASYRPLIRNALHHGQRVLAWQGWPGERRLLWGVVEAETDGGVGFRGTVYDGWGDGALGEADEAGNMGAQSLDFPVAGVPCILEEPPVQLYVVERMALRRPEPGDIFPLAVQHAKHILDYAVGDRFGVVTGPDVYTTWIQRIMALARECSVSEIVDTGTLLLAAALIRGHQSALGFFRRMASGLRLIPSGQVAALCVSVEEITHSLRPMMKWADRPPPSATAEGVVGLLEKAQRATMDLREKLNELPSFTPG